MKYKYLGYNDIFPDVIVNKSNVKKFITKSDLFGDEQIGYLVIKYNDNDYNKEKNRLYSLASNSKYDHYGIQSFNKELCAIYSNYKGVIYALSDDKNLEISYVDIQFYGYDCTINYNKIISREDLPIGFDALEGNKTNTDYSNGDLFYISFDYIEKGYINDECNDFYYLYNKDNKELLISSINKIGYEKSSFSKLHDLYIKFDNKVEIITFEKNEKIFKPNTMRQAFYNEKLKKINGFENIDTSNVIDFMDCFSDSNCVDDSILDSLKTDSGMYFSYMFYNCGSITYFDASKYDFSNATLVDGMFENCKNLEEVDFSKCNLNKIKHTQEMFKSCINLKKADFSNSGLVNCISLHNMFNECSSLKEIKFDNINMFNVRNIDGIFQSCSSLEVIDLSDIDFVIPIKFYISKYLSNKSHNYGIDLFKDCSSLKYIFLPKSFKLNYFKIDDNISGCDSLEAIYYKDIDNIDLIKTFKE